MEHHEVVIIGAGISGLAAAELLDKHKVEYVIIEARDRIGGRIETNRKGLTEYDLGASWAHDTLTNPLFDKILEDNEIHNLYSLYYDDQYPLYFTKDRGPQYVSSNKIEQVVKELEKFIEIRYFEEIGKRDVSLKEIIAEYIRKQSRVLTKEQVLLAPQLARHLELWHGIGWEQMSSKFGLVDNVGRNCLFRNGYDKVIEQIHSKLDQNKILKNSIVKLIDRSTSTVKIELTDGRVINSNWVICTVPQSILQLPIGEIGAIEWRPSLPANIKESLDNMSWGKLGKVVFEFDTAWWGHHDTDRFVALANSDNQLFEVWCQSTGASAKHGIHGTILSRLANVDLDSDETQDNRVQVTPPVNTIVSQWTVDPFSRGSYAACKPGDDPTDLVIHLERGLDKVRFAGEHTILDGAGAVHGAWMSGRREAEHILIREGKLEGELNEW
ncbi:hypothetical protein CAS74_002909 [Pichia kudriavzevii]|uniref:Amine oxidase n=1 Tax=Pichia kudriavzevii TaxID=4909 RepID=A0A1Z8JMU9_PICKU|nr:hypothetical protein CAS74_002909 [Pichia kudriavzevii]